MHFIVSIQTDFLRSSSRNSINKLCFNGFDDCCCCCYWPPVREVCLNYEVMDFQPRTLTTPDLGSVTYCYLHLLDLPYPLLMLSNAPPPQLSSSIVIPHEIIRPPGRHPSLSKHTKKPLPAFPSPVTSRYRLLLSPLAPTTSAGFPLPPLPHCHRNIF